MLRISIDLARGVASLAVFLFHISEKIRPYSDSWSLVAKYGFYGVPIFFVISGYCITSSADGFVQRNGSSLAFLKKRFLRIYPPFWGSILVILLVPYLLELASYLHTGHLLWPHRDWQNYDLSDWIQVFTLLKVFSGVNDQPLHSVFSGINPVYWTLAIEFQFYLVVFFALLFRKYFAAILWVVTAISLFTESIRTTGLFIGYWPLFSLGVGLYYTLKHGVSPDQVFKQWSKPIVIGLIAISLFLISVLAQNDALESALSTKFSDPWLSFAILSALGLWLMSSMETVLDQCVKHRNPLLAVPIKLGVFLGGISYSLYLLHPKIYQVIDKLTSLIKLNDTALNPILIVFGTIIFSWIFYRYFEHPFINTRVVRVTSK